MKNNVKDKFKKQKKNRKTLKKELTEGEWMADSIAIAHVELRWLDTVFQGQYLPSLSINYVAVNKVLEKLPPQLY